MGPGGSVTKSLGDLPGGVDVPSRRNLHTLSAVLFQNKSAGRISAHQLAPWQRAPAALSSSFAPAPLEVELPQWLQTGAHVCYYSRSSRQRLEVVVDKVSHIKKEIRIHFAFAPDVWKCIPFSLLPTPSNPLLGPWVPGVSDGGVPTVSKDASTTQAPAASELPVVDLEDEADNPCAADSSGADHRHRSRSPRRAALQPSDEG